MAGNDLDIADIYFFADTHGGALHRISRAERGNRFHLAVNVPVYGRGYIGYDEGAVLLCTNADFLIRVSEDFKLVTESASVLRDQTDLGASHRFAMIHKTTANQRAIRNCDGLASCSCGHRDQLRRHTPSLHPEHHACGLLAVCEFKLPFWVGDRDGFEALYGPVHRDWTVRQRRDSFRHHYGRTQRSAVLIHHPATDDAT